MKHEIDRQGKGEKPILVEGKRHRGSRVVELRRGKLHPGGGTRFLTLTPHHARLVAYALLSEASQAEHDTEQAEPQRPSKGRKLYALECTDGKGWLRRRPPAKPGDTATWRVVDESKRASTYTQGWVEEKRAEAAKSLPDVPVKVAVVPD